MFDPVPVSGLRRLWQQAFGDTDAFLDLFFAHGFSPERCLWSEENGRVTAGLYWLDCEYRGKKLAYIYAVATDEAFRGRGLCRDLMGRAHEILARRGYAGSILVPGEPELAGLYEKLGYRFCGGIREITCGTGEPVALKKLSRQEYALLRRRLLPGDSVIQEGESLGLLEALGDFYGAEGLCLWAARDGEGLVTGELLGETAMAPGVVRALGGSRGRFRTPGSTPFAMFRPLEEVPAPAYLGHAFD